MTPLFTKRVFFATICLVVTTASAVPQVSSLKHPYRISSRFQLLGLEAWPTSFLFWQLRFRNQGSVADKLADVLSQASQHEVLTQSLMVQGQSQHPQETATGKQSLVSERLASIAAAVASQETAPHKQGSVAERLANAHYQSKPTYQSLVKAPGEFLQPEVRCQRRDTLMPMWTAVHVCVRLCTRVAIVNPLQAAAAGVLSKPTLCLRAVCPTGYSPVVRAGDRTEAW